MHSVQSRGRRGDNDRREIFGQHRSTLALWAVFLTSFILVVSLYAKFSEPFLLGVYELMQVYRAQIEGRSVQAAIIDYEDYLRVDPESIYVRGLLVNSFIEIRKHEEAEEQAEIAQRLTTEEQRPLSWLIAARVQLAKSDLGKALPYIQEVLSTVPDSGEGHYQMAQVYLAQGDLEEAEEEFALVRTLGTKGSTREYLEDWNARLGRLEEYERVIAAGVESAQRLYELGVEFQKMGRLDKARELYSKAKSSGGFTHVSRGVLEIPAFEF